MTGSAPALPADIAVMPYEQARDELTALVRTLESGTASLEDSLSLWERGEQLARRCQEVLDGAIARLDAARHVDATEPPAEADVG